MGLCRSQSNNCMSINNLKQKPMKNSKVVTRNTSGHLVCFDSAEVDEIKTKYGDHGYLGIVVKGVLIEIARAYQQATAEQLYKGSPDVE